MNQREISLKENIMWRVRFIYGVKSLPRVFAPKIALLSSLVAAAGFLVSFPNVFRNMPSLLDIASFIEFVVTAFLNTKLIIQVIMLGTIVVVFYMIRDLARPFRILLPQLTR